MPDPRAAITEIPPAGERGVVKRSPSSLSDKILVRIPAFDDHHVTEVRRWMPRGPDDLPAVGDEVLVIVDDDGEPWVVAWWPGG